MAWSEDCKKPLWWMFSVQSNLTFDDLKKKNPKKNLKDLILNASCISGFNWKLVVYN